MQPKHIVRAGLMVDLHDDSRLARLMIIAREIDQYVSQGEICLHFAAIFFIQNSNNNNNNGSCH